MTWAGSASHGIAMNRRNLKRLKNRRTITRNKKVGILRKSKRDFKNVGGALLKPRHSSMYKNRVGKEKRKGSIVKRFLSFLFYGK